MNDVMEMVCTHLDIRDVVALRGTCKQYRDNIAIKDIQFKNPQTVIVPIDSSAIFHPSVRIIDVVDYDQIALDFALCQDSTIRCECGTYINKNCTTNHIKSEYHKGYVEFWKTIDNSDVSGLPEDYQQWRSNYLVAKRVVFKWYASTKKVSNHFKNDDSLFRNAVIGKNRRIRKLHDEFAERNFTWNQNTIYQDAIIADLLHILQFNEPVPGLGLAVSCFSRF